MKWITKSELQRRDLEREATKILRRARRPKPPRPSTAPMSDPTGPRRYTLSDLAMLRRQGRVP